jgi:hypothetical protein
VGCLETPTTATRQLKRTLRHVSICGNSCVRAFGHIERFTSLLAQAGSDAFILRLTLLILSLKAPADPLLGCLCPTLTLLLILSYLILSSNFSTTARPHCTASLMAKACMLLFAAAERSLGFPCGELWLPSATGVANWALLWPHPWLYARELH